MNLARLLLFIILLLAPLTTHSAPITSDQIPNDLAPWQEWVLYGQDDRSCATVWHQGNQRRCRWPGELTLTINNDGGTFQQYWQLDREEWLVLPGDSQHWPQQVLLNNQPALVMRSDSPSIKRGPTTSDSTIATNRPMILVPAGKHLVSGHFCWHKMPKNLPIDPNTALIKLTRNGTFIHQPQLDRGGLLWLNKDASNNQQTEQDEIRFRIFRHVTDSIPLQLTTRLQLEVSGQAREIRTAIILPGVFVPQALNSPLPARLESDGTLRLQLKPGNWTVELVSRHLGPIDILTMLEPQGPWATQEVWSIETRNELRVVSIENGTAIDPSQTGMPSAWKQLPAYLMKPNQSLKLVPRKRGDSDPATEQLHMQRTLWLDFDGKGYTVKDQINGQLTSSSRLEADPLLELGRATINGQDQLVTRLTPQSGAGIELRQGKLNLEAESRITPQNTNELPAVGWQMDPASLHTQLNLPPGWRLLEATGPDSASSTWLRSWSLLDLFIVLILALSFGRMWGVLTGVGALLGMALIYHEPNAPQLVWLNVLIPIALLRVLPEGRFKHLTGWYRNAGLLALLVISLTFSVQQIRSAIYPQLDPQVSRYQHYGHSSGVSPQRMKSKALPVVSMIRSSMDEEMAVAPKRLIPQYDPDLKIQTGPGVPKWQWRRVELRWDGPVTTDQQLKLYLLPPLATRLLLLGGVLLMSIMFLRLLSQGSLPRWRRSPPKATPPALLIFTITTAMLTTMLTMAATTVEAAFPEPILLEQLQQRLLEPESCAPNCIALDQLEISADQQRLRLRMTFHAQVDSAVPLPFPAHQLHLQSATQEQAPLYRDTQQNLWARIPKGKHTLELYAILPQGLQRLQLPLPMAAGMVHIKAGKWQTTGIQDGEASHGPIELTRLSSSSEKQLQPGEIPPFVEVQRQLHLGLDWQIKTTVRRLSQAGHALILNIPLLPNERVTSPGVQIKDHQALFSMAPNAHTFSWNSSLEKTSQLELLAGQSGQFVEVWQLHADPIWHVKSTGIPVIYHYQFGRWQPQWRPWNGEKLTLDVTRPAGIKGQNVTIDSSQLQINPGKRTTKVELNLQLRSSHGTDHTITLPDQAKLDQVTINGRAQPIKQHQRLITVPLVPGSQTIQLKWQQPQGVDLITRTPQVHLGAASVDAKITLNLPHSRWTLFTCGPVLGPAVLFWGVLLVIIVMSFILGRFTDTPLRWWHWLLLFAGLSQASLPALIPVAAWLIFLGLRQKWVERLDSPWSFNIAQITLVALSLIAMLTIIGAIQQGLLGLPEMQVAGNNSSAWNLHWYQDRSSGFLPEAWVLSVPMYIYRLLMLLWALWLALALLKWLQWGWTCFSSHGLWRKPLPRVPRPSRAERKAQATQQEAPQQQSE